jgi:hypothetical protein
MNCCGGPSCIATCIGIALAWLLVASGLLFLTWNRVVGAVAKVKPVKYWQALLFLVTVGVLFAPCAAMKKRHGCGAGHGQSCPFDRHAQPKAPDAPPAH